MNSNHPITELETAIRQMLDNKILDWDRPSQLITVDAERNYSMLVPGIYALCRSFAASELRAAAGSDDEISEQYGADYTNWLRGRNELRRTLRVRASELTKENENE